MKSTSKKHWITTVLVTAALLIIIAPAAISTAEDILEQRVQGLEARVTNLEATVEALTSEDSAESPASGNHNITGEYIERPEVVAGKQCTNFYPTGTIVFISDWEGAVLGTGELGDGKLVDDGLCSQSFEIENVPTSPGYVVNIERRVPGSAYEFTLEDIEENDWHFEVVSRYRK